MSDTNQAPAAATKKKRLAQEKKPAAKWKTRQADKTIHRLTLDGVAAVLEVTPRQVQRYMVDPDDPLTASVKGKRPEPDLFDVAEIIKWSRRRVMRDTHIDDDGNIYSLEVERARLTHHQANKTALEEQQLDGVLIPAEEVEREWGKIATEIRSRLLALPTRLAQVAIAATTLHEIETACTTEIHGVLGDLADNGNHTDQPSGPDLPSSETTTTANGRAVG